MATFGLPGLFEWTDAVLLFIDCRIRVTLWFFFYDDPKGKTRNRLKSLSFLLPTLGVTLAEFLITGVSSFIFRSYFAFRSVYGWLANLLKAPWREIELFSLDFVPFPLAELIFNGLLYPLTIEVFKNRLFGTPSFGVLNRSSAYLVWFSAGLLPWSF